MGLANEGGLRSEVTYISGEQAAEGAANCLLSVYGEKENYVYPDMLDRDCLVKKIRGGEMKVFAAVSRDGRPAATLSCKKNPREKAVEITALAVHPSYRGLTLGECMTGHLLVECKKMGETRFYALMVLFHTQSAAVYEKMGFVPTGFLFGVCDAKKHLAQLHFKSQKHSWAVYLKTGGHADAGTVYLPFHLNDIVREIYKSAGAGVRIAEHSGEPNGASRIEYEQDGHHKTLYITVTASGGDLRRQVEALEKQHTGALQTGVVYLNINDPGAVHGYQALSAFGYGFAGLKPLCGEHEYLIMSKTNRVLIDRAELQMTDSVRRLLERIGDQA